MNKLFVADIRNGLPEIEDNSIDVIITDPPYPKEFLYVWGELGKVGHRVLKEGGSLIAMSGQYYLLDVLNAIAPHLTYHWLISYLMPQAPPRMWPKKVMNRQKSIVWFTKGKYVGDWRTDCIYVAWNNTGQAKEKTFHKWQQSLDATTLLVNKFTSKGDSILDPFLGSGTTALACLQLGRDFVGCDIDPECIAITQKRVNAYQPIEKWMK